VFDANGPDGVCKYRESRIVVQVELAAKESVDQCKTHPTDGKTREGGILCDVPVDEKVSWLCSDDYALWHATICAADPQDLWGLTFRAALEEVEVF
jgi:hypothetical protein